MSTEGRSSSSDDDKSKTDSDNLASQEPVVSELEKADDDKSETDSDNMVSEEPVVSDLVKTDDDKPETDSDNIVSQKPVVSELGKTSVEDCCPDGSQKTNRSKYVNRPEGAIDRTKTTHNVETAKYQSMSDVTNCSEADASYTKECNHVQLDRHCEKESSSLQSGESLSSESVSVHESSCDKMNDLPEPIEQTHKLCKSYNTDKKTRDRDMQTSAASLSSSEVQSLPERSVISKQQDVKQKPFIFTAGMKVETTIQNAGLHNGLIQWRCNALTTQNKSETKETFSFNVPKFGSCSRQMVVPKQYKTNKSQLCQFCDKTAVKICEECTSVFCKTCVKLFHSRGGTTDHHRPKALERYVLSELCPDHGVIFSHYCNECMKRLCTDCVMFGPCKAHRIARIADFVKAKKRNLLDLLEEASLTLNKVDHYEVELDDMIESIQLSHLEQREHVRQEFIAFHDLLMRKESEVLNMLNDGLDQSKKRLEHLKSKYHDLQRGEEELSTEVTQLVQMPCRMTFMQKETAARRRCKTLVRSIQSLPNIEDNITKLLRFPFSLFEEKRHFDIAATSDIDAGVTFTQKTLYLTYSRLATPLDLSGYVDALPAPPSTSTQYALEVKDIKSKTFWRTDCPKLSQMTVNTASTVKFQAETSYLVKVSPHHTCQKSSHSQSVKHGRPAHMLIVTGYPNEEWTCDMDCKEDTTFGCLRYIKSLVWLSFEEIHWNWQKIKDENDERNKI